MTVTATDPGGLSATQAFKVTVPNRVPVAGEPIELGELSKFEELDLGSNLLTGEIPPELGDLSNLDYLFLDHNSLTGEIPSDFLDLSSLAFFYWSDNDGLCAPNTSEFDEWLDGLIDWHGPR